MSFSHGPALSLDHQLSVSAMAKGHSTPDMASSFRLLINTLPVLQTHFASYFYNDIFHDGPAKHMVSFPQIPTTFSYVACLLLNTNVQAPWFACVASLSCWIQTFQDRNQSSIISDIITLTHSEVLLSNEKAIVFGYRQIVSVTFIFLNYDVETGHFRACCED